MSRGELYRGERSVIDFCLASFSSFGTEAKFETIHPSLDMAGGLNDEEGMLSRSWAAPAALDGGCSCLPTATPCVASAASTALPSL